MIIQFPKQHVFQIRLSDMTTVYVRAVKCESWEVTVESERNLTAEEKSWIEKRIYIELREYDLKDWNPSAGR